MKYRDKEGREVSNAKEAREIYCRVVRCRECAIRKIDELPCHLVVERAPDTALKLMGFNVVEEEPTRCGAEQNKTTRETILQAAQKCVCGDREQDYGSPEKNFQTIADLWATYLKGCGVSIDFLEPWDVAAMLALLKIARISSGHAKADNWIDLAGYAACGGELEAEQ